MEVTKTSKFILQAERKEDESILDTLLRARNIEDKDEFFNAENTKLTSPFIFQDMKKAVEIINQAILNQDKIVVWGDFDSDGVTSSCIMHKTLKALGANFETFLPDRVNLGHGLNLKELINLKSKSGMKVLITVDCGISNTKEIEVLRSFGVKTIITDHHEPPETLPNADCIINALAKNSINSETDFKTIKDNSYLAGAGTSLKLSFALLDDEKYKELRDEIVILSAIGTISDVVPLIGENRIIAAKGLKLLNEGKYPQIQRFFETQSFQKKIKSDDIAFILTPRINAAGRLDHPNTAFDFLTSENKEQIESLIVKLDSLNKVRQSLCEKIYDEALSMISTLDDSIVLYNPEWHMGIIGIVASRLVEKFNVPVFLITKDDKSILRSSIRGCGDYNISNILKTLGKNFLGYGGHKLAGGFSADENLHSIEELISLIKNTVKEFKPDVKIESTLKADIELFGGELNFELIEEIEKLEPFGALNEQPVFLFANAKVLSSKTIGKEQNHLMFNIEKDGIEYRCLWWKRKELGVNSGETINFSFKPEVDTFNNETKINIIAVALEDDPFSIQNIKPAIKIYDHRQKTGILPKINEYLKDKKDKIKVIANTIETKGTLKSFIYIQDCINSNEQASTVMLFDYPENLELLSSLKKEHNFCKIHLMRENYSKNPETYITKLCGMLKWASHNKNGEIELSVLSKNLGLDEICVQTALELLEKIGCIEILDINQINYLKAPTMELVKNDSSFELFKDEYDRVIQFKDYLQKVDTDTFEKLLNN